MGKDNLHRAVRHWPAVGPAEQSFLLAAVRQGEEVPLPAGSLDWPTLTKRIIDDGLAPLLYHRFRSRPEHLPPPTFNQLKHHYYQNASVNHIRQQELKRIGQSFSGRDIPILVLKGAALATTIYEDPALRFMGDLDIAVPPHQASEALTLLQQDGYQPIEEASNNQQLAFLHEKGWHVGLRRMVWGKQIDLEFHWPLRQSVLINQAITLDVQQLWQTAVPLDQTANLWQPAPPLMLLHLCLHTGLQHRFTDFGLRQYIDLDRLIRQQGEQATFWADFITQAKAIGASHLSYACLSLCQQLLQTPVPAGTLTALRPPSWKQGILARRLPPADVLNRARSLYDHRRIWWRLLTLDRPGDLLLGPWRLLFPGRDYVASYYHTQHPVELLAYTLLHPLHALSRAGRHRLSRSTK